MKVPKNFKKQFNKSGFFLIKNFYDKTEINKSLKTFKLKETKLKKKALGLRESLVINWQFMELKKMIIICIN